MSRCTADRTNTAVTAQMDTTDSNTPRISDGHKSASSKSHVCFVVTCWKSAPDIHPVTRLKRSFLQRRLLQARFLTRSLPPEGQDACRRPGGQPQREEADCDAAKVSQKMRRICHDGQTASGVSTCRQGVKPESRFFLLCKGLKYHPFLLPIISPAMKTRLTAQAMHSFLLARCLASLSGSNVEAVCWQSRRSSSSEALWLSSDAESQQVSGGEPLLKHRTAGFHTNKTHLKEFQTYHPRGSSSCCFSEHSMSSGKSTSGTHVSLT